VTPLDLKAIFDAAAEITDPADRAAYLDRACTGAPDVRREVDALLRALEQAGGFLARPAVAPGDTEERSTAAPAVEAGTVVAGRYRLLQQIGIGGMGTVWMADQTEPVKRRVAVKLVRADRAASTAILTRFEAERQAIALMDHPNIARLLDAGTSEDGSPFFVMELVKGVPVTEFCDAHRLSVPDRLELFRHVCAAVRHAHQKGIIHRDLKPSNILVESHDGTPVPKVIDFGLAKATTGLHLTEHTLFTAFGNVLGTPLYMAPEQATFNAVDVDTRADVYALGVILYELLTGTTPLERETVKTAALDEMLRLVREQEAPAPSSRLSATEAAPAVATNRGTEPQKLGRFVRGELDWVVMKALEKDRSRRYGSATEFAADVERFLNHEPVGAGPPTVRYKVRKFIRRHRGPVLAAALGLAALVTGLVGTGVALAAVERQRVRTADERDRKDRALQSERAARGRAMTALRRLTDEVVEKQLARRPALTADDRRFIREILGQYEEFAALPGDEAEQRAVRAEGFARVGGLRHRLGEEAEAAAAYSRALDLYSGLAADFPDQPGFRHQQALARVNLAAVYRATGRLPEAEAALIAARATLGELNSDRPTDPDLRSDLAAAAAHVGGVAAERGRPAEAEAALRESVATSRALVREFAGRPTFRRELASTLIDLGMLLRDLGQPDAADAAYSEAVTMLRAIVKASPDDPGSRQILAAALNDLGLVRASSKEPGAAVAPYTEAVREFQQLAADFPTIPKLRHDLAAAEQNLGDLLSDLKKPDQAEAKYRDALALYKKLAEGFTDQPEFRLNLAKCHNALGVLLGDTDRPTQAADEYGEALTIFRNLVSDQSDQPDYQNELAGTLGNLGGLATRRRDFARARRLLEEALPHNEAALKANRNHPSYRQFYRNNLVELTKACGGLDDRDAAVAAAGRLRDLGWESPGVHAYDAACALALCVPLANPDGKGGGPRAGFYADRAMDFLREAVLRGFDDPNQLREDRDLNPLRGRDDFKALLTDLEKRFPRTAKDQPHATAKSD
jgi:tetratricopeptide (TPR) repeat protein